MPAGKPTAIGNLRQTPFCELLVYALQQPLSGSLVLEAPDRRKHALVFQEGEIIKVRVDDASTRLGQVLVELGVVEEQARTAAAASSRGFFGERLLSQGVSRESLLRGLGEQRLRQVAWLSRLSPPTAFGYYEGVDWLSRWGPGPFPMDPLACIWAAVCAASDEARMVAACEAVEQEELRLHPDSRVGRFGFASPERAMLDVLRVKPQGLAALRATRLLDSSNLQRLVYTLLLTGHLDRGQSPLGVPLAMESPAAPPQVHLQGDDAGRVPVPAGKAVANRGQVQVDRSPSPGKSTAAPQRSTAAPQRGTAETGHFLTRKEVLAKVEHLEESSCYDVLEISSDAPQADVATAFAELARRWHPDRLNPAYPELRETVTRVFAKMTEANRRIGTTEARASYDEELFQARAEEEEQREVARVLRAAGAFQKAEILIKKRDMTGAEEFARIAVESDDEQPEYVALFAWIRTRRPDCSADELGRSVKVLRDTAKKQPNNVRIHYYLATALKRNGEEAAAMREFRYVANNDPSNLDAARELRLYEMRSSSQRAESGGLLGRLFRR